MNIKRMIFRIILISAFAVMASVSPALCATVSYGSYSFSETDSWVTFPKFDPGLGMLNSVTFEIKDMEMSVNLIIDVDDDKGSLYVEEFQLSVTPLITGDYGNPIFIEYFSQIDSSPYSGSSQSGDDGDGRGSRDGGADEIDWLIDYPIYSSASTISEERILDELSGIDSFSTSAGPFSYWASPMSGDREIEYYTENFLFSGQLFVHYDYTVVPIPGAIWLLSSSLIVLIGIKRKYRKKI